MSTIPDREDGELDAPLGDICQGLVRKIKKNTTHEFY
jgi:hypothetical protein